MKEIVILTRTPTKDEMSALVSTTTDHVPESALGCYDMEKGEVVVSEGFIPDLLDKEVKFPEAYDYIRGIFGLRPIFGIGQVVYNPQKREMERILDF